MRERERGNERRLRLRNKSDDSSSLPARRLQRLKQRNLQAATNEAEPTGVHRDPRPSAERGIPLNCPLPRGVEEANRGRAQAAKGFDSERLYRAQAGIRARGVTDPLGRLRNAPSGPILSSRARDVLGGPGMTNGDVHIMPRATDGVGDV